MKIAIAICQFLEKKYKKKLSNPQNGDEDEDFDM